VTAAATPLGCPRRGTPRSRAIAGRLLGLCGWRIEGRVPEAPKFVLIVAPHTSNWDFPIGVMAMFALGLRATWLGKHTLFRFPVRGLLRWLGGEPVDRRVAHGTVGMAIARFAERSQWVLAVSPEGTRGRVVQWKTGFHRIAAGAGVPIQPVSFDFSRRTITILDLVMPTDDVAADMTRLRRLFHPEMARYPDLFVAEPDTPAA